MAVVRFCPFRWLKEPKPAFGSGSRAVLGPQARGGGGGWADGLVVSELLIGVLEVWVGVLRAAVRAGVLGALGGEPGRGCHRPRGECAHRGSCLLPLPRGRRGAELCEPGGSR